ncbi:hypothetical protein CV103_21755 [Sphingomonas fennica]|uniref:Uncharacterized protein n=1 Tax=Edaphosphingomonas fennica TaxID=114404 RepID=A0A2T4HJ98_9SPHN|nr:hypothetical protein CV103_21755 [Sphingomonas fennica]
MASAWQADARPAQQDGGNDVEETAKKAGQIATQPVRDVGVDKKDIPPALADAVLAPYAMGGLKTCKQISTAIGALTEHLGPDFKGGEPKRENKAGKLAEAGGKTVVNAFIPFRGLVREISGAAPAERRYAVAVDAGLARRGFLRGLYTARNCKPALP